MDDSYKDCLANLNSYKIQLNQVEAALLSAPDNSELLKLKEDLEEVIKITLNLTQTTSSQWTVGSTCRALNIEGQIYSPAVVEKILNSQECVVKFENGISIPTKISSLRRPEEVTEPKKKPKVTPNTVVREKKKRKARPRDLEGLSAVNEMCRRQQSNWKDFNGRLTKANKGKLSKSLTLSTEKVTGMTASKGTLKTPYSSNPHKGF